MFGIGFWELIVILIAAFVVVGPEDSVKHAKKVISFIKNLKGFKSEVMESISEVNLNKDQSEDR